MDRATYYRLMGRVTRSASWTAMSGEQREAVRGRFQTWAARQGHRPLGYDAVVQPCNCGSAACAATRGHCGAYRA